MGKISSVYSPSKNNIYPAALYDSYIAAGAWPTDGFDISEEDAAMFNGGNKPTGKMLGMINGSLTWIDEPPLSSERLKADAENMRATARAMADYEIAWRQDALDAGIATAEETAALAEWKKYRVLLMRVDTAKPVWPTPPEGQAS